MVTYKMPNQWKKGKSGKLRGGDQIKSIDLKDLKCYFQPNELRMIQYLLGNNNNKRWSRQIGNLEKSVGIPQGDGSFPLLFATYLFHATQRLKGSRSGEIEDFESRIKIFHPHNEILVEKLKQKSKTFIRNSI